MMNVLLLGSEESVETDVFSFLLEKGFQVELLHHPSDVLEKIQNQEIQLVICNEKIGNRSGFHVFKMLKAVLFSKRIPFFLIMENYEKEDIMVALELGINNLIFYPLNSESILQKIEAETRKHRMDDYFKSENFTVFFQQSQSPMLFVERDKIWNINQAAKRLPGLNDRNPVGLGMEGVFEVNSTETNQINFRRFKNEIIHFCRLHEVPHCSTGQLFDLMLFRSDVSIASEYLVEVSPVNTEQRCQPFATPSGMSFESGGIKLDRKLPVNLTEREKQVLDLSAAGLPIKLIADDLKVSTRTVEKHRGNIMEKAGARNIIEAIVSYYTQSGKSNYLFQNGESLSA